MDHKEVDGDVLPAYTGVNVPHYARGAAHDTDVPHDFTPRESSLEIDVTAEGAPAPAEIVGVPMPAHLHEMAVRARGSSVGKVPVTATKEYIEGRERVLGGR